MSRFPEHDKLSEIKDRTQAIGEFVDWLSDTKGVVLASIDDYGNASSPRQSLIDLMAEWAGIDLDKIEAEKREMLAELRRANGYEE